MTELIYILFAFLFQSEFTWNISFNFYNFPVKTIVSVLLFSFYEWRKWKPKNVNLLSFLLKA